MRKLIAFPLLMILMGCVPANYLRFGRGFGNASAYLPLNFSATNFDLTVKTNSFSFHADVITVTNSPAVIDAATARAVAIIQATGGAVGEAIAKSK